MLGRLLLGDILVGVKLILGRLELVGDLLVGDASSFPFALLADPDDFGDLVDRAESGD